MRRKLFNHAAAISLLLPLVFTTAMPSSSQTPPDRAAEVQRRLRTASPAAVEAFQISSSTFAVRKLILIGRK